jgi:tetratricopeptide (TPR) repeat protein
MEYFQKRFEFSCDDSLRIDRGFSYNSQVLEPPQLLAGRARKIGNEKSRFETWARRVGMSGTRKVAGLAMVAALCLTLGNGLSALARPQAPAAGAQDAGAGKPQYTMPEYNAEQAAAAEKNPAQQVKLLDDFVSKYPNSALLIYVYPLYVQAYGQLKNYQKVIEYSDKVVGMGAKIDAGGQYQALYAHCFAYNALSSTPWANEPANAKAARDAAVAGLKALDDVKKPDGMTDDAFAAQKKQIQIYFNGTAAQASMAMKDNASAIPFYKAMLALNPDDGVTSYRLGLAYEALGQHMDAFWSIARAVTAKGATEAQSKKVKDYLRKLIVNYQQAACDNLTDAELAELLQLAGSSAERPASYALPSSADLDAARKDMTIASVVTDLKAGGDKAKVTWLASCGLEFPGVPAKVIENVPGDVVVLKVAFVTSDAEFDAKTTPDMDVKIAGQPEVSRVEKDSAIHFIGTLVSYDPDPAFMLHWEKGKVNEEDIPKEKGAPKKTPAKKRPSGKSNN